MWRICPKCGRMMSRRGIRWSKSRKRFKFFYTCEWCRLLFYESDLAKADKARK